MPEICKKLWCLQPCRKYCQIPVTPLQSCGRWKLFVDFLPSDFPSVVTEFYIPGSGKKYESDRIRIRFLNTWFYISEVGMQQCNTVVYDTCLGINVHCKKRLAIFPSPAGMSLTKLSMVGNNRPGSKLFPAIESLVSDIPAGDGKIANLFYSVEMHTHPTHLCVVCLQLPK